MLGEKEALQYYQEKSTMKMIDETLPILEKLNSIYREFDRLDWAYKNIVHNEALLIRKIAGSQQYHDIYLGIFKYLYVSGVFSVVPGANKFIFGDDKEEIPCNLGLSISTGIGVCRNIASHFMDVLNEINKINQTNNSYFVVPTRVSSDDIVVKKLPKEFKEKIDPEMKETLKELDNEPSSAYAPNHLEVLCLTNGVLRVYDPTLFRVRQIHQEKKSEERKIFDLRFNVYRNGYIKNPVSFLLKADGSRDRFEEALKVPLSVSFHERIMREAIFYCETAGDDIQEFCRATEKYYKIVVEEKSKCYAKAHMY